MQMQIFYFVATLGVKIIMNNHAISQYTTDHQQTMCTLLETSHFFFENFSVRIEFEAKQQYIFNSWLLLCIGIVTLWKALLMLLHICRDRKGTEGPPWQVNPQNPGTRGRVHKGGLNRIQIWGEKPGYAFHKRNAPLGIIYLILAHIKSFYDIFSSIFIVILRRKR